MKRSGSVEEILYEDAINRNIKMDSIAKGLTNREHEPISKFTLEKSELVMAKKLVKEVNETLLSCNHPSSDFDKIDF